MGERFPVRTRIHRVYRLTQIMAVAMLARNSAGGGCAKIKPPCKAAKFKSGSPIEPRTILDPMHRRTGQLENDVFQNGRALPVDCAAPNMGQVMTKPSFCTIDPNDPRLALIPDQPGWATRSLGTVARYHPSSVRPSNVRPTGGPRCFGVVSTPLQGRYRRIWQRTSPRASWRC